MTPRRHLERLREHEYANPLELVFRLVGVGLGSLALYFYTGEIFTLGWMAGCYISHLMFEMFLRLRTQTATWTDYYVAQALFCVMLAAFIWAPTWMLVQPQVALSLIGAALIGCILVNLVMRSEVSLFLIFGQLVVLGGAMVSVLPSVLTRVDTTLGVIGLLLSWAALLCYYALTMLTSRARALSERQAETAAAQAQKLAAIGQLAGGVAHDFNNNLTVISGNLELYEEMEDEAERAACIDAARMASHQAAQIVRQLLIFARKSPLTLEVMDANAPLDEVAVLARRLIPRNITMTITPMTESVQVRADKDQLITALINLVVNAVDAMPQGGMLKLSVVPVGNTTTLHWLTQPPPASGNYAGFEVSDTGNGIPADVLVHVTEPFFSTKDVGKGTGLGLSMVASISDVCGGGLAVRTGPGGTLFCIVIPMVH